MRSSYNRRLKLAFGKHKPQRVDEFARWVGISSYDMARYLEGEPIESIDNFKAIRRFFEKGYSKEVERYLVHIWDCPRCGWVNQTDYCTVLRPECGRCDRQFSWNELLTPEEISESNLVKAEYLLEKTEV